MRNCLRALAAVLVIGTALILTSRFAYADSMDEVTVAHRGRAPPRSAKAHCLPTSTQCRTGRTSSMPTCAGRRMVRTPIAWGQ
jgi:hypothetical protein